MNGKKSNHCLKTLSHGGVEQNRELNSNICIP